MPCMKILALETTEQFGSVALLEQRGENAVQSSDTLAEIVLPRDRRSSQTLHPAIQTLLTTTQTVPKEIGIIVVVAGPGSFTGLRVGVTAAKLFAYTTGAKVIAVDTFQTIAFGHPVTDPNTLLSVGVNAQRGEVVAAVLHRTKEGKIDVVKEPELIPVADWWNHAEQYDDVLFAGPALEQWAKKAPPNIRLTLESNWFPKASSAGKLAGERIISQQFDDYWALRPIYSRLSAAEEKQKRK